MNRDQQHYSTAWPLLLAIISLATMLAYTIIFAFYTPGNGVLVNRTPRGWRVTDTVCNEAEAWCRHNRQALLPEDLIVEVDGVNQNGNNRHKPLFADHQPGDMAVLQVLRDDQLLEVRWIMPPALPLREKLIRMTALLLPLPFWLVGVVVATRPRTRDRCWLVAVVFFFLYSMWMAAGVVSSSQIIASSLVLHALTWLALPVSIHMHLLLPKPMERPLRVLPALYVFTVVMALLEMAQALPSTLFYAALAVQVLINIQLLMARLLLGVAVVQSRMMLAGLALAFTPGIFWVLLTTFGGTTGDTVFANIVALAFLIWPLFYLYAIYRQDLGRWEPWLRHGLIMAGFACIYLIVASILLAVAGRQLGWAPHDVNRATFASAIAVIVMLPIFRRVEPWVDTTLYGRMPNLNRAMVLFAQQAAAAATVDDLIVLSRRAASYLGINPTAVYLKRRLPADKFRLMAADGVEAPLSILDTPACFDTPQFAWTRLRLPLVTHDGMLGFWLIGDKTQDDFYYPAEIQRLQQLADQLTAAIDNVLLRGDLEAELSKKERVHRLVARHQKMAALGQLSARISHEMMTPLQAIILSLEPVADDPTDPGTPERLGRAIDRVEYLAKLIRRIRRFVQPSADEASWLNVDDVLRDALALAAGQIRAAQVDVHTHIAGSLPAVWMSSGDLSQLFINLITNACEAMMYGGTLSITATVEGEWIAINFADTGSGIRPEHLDRVFDPFFTTKPNGTGLGLSISYNIVERGHGRLEVESASGQGTIFTIWLPLPQENRGGYE